MQKQSHSQIGVLNFNSILLRNFGFLSFFEKSSITQEEFTETLFAERATYPKAS